MILRILVSTMLLFSVLFAPFWVSAVLAFLAMIYFSKFFEAAVLFFLSDLLYGTKTAEAGGFHMIFISFITAALFLIIIEIVKKKLKFYPSKQH